MASRKKILGGDTVELDDGRVIRMTGSTLRLGDFALRAI